MDPAKPTLMTENFGPLQGVRILSTGTIVAEPVAAGMAADMGAEVIHIEKPGKGEDWRVAEFPIETPDGGLAASSWIQDHRNMYHTTLGVGRRHGFGGQPEHRHLSHFGVRPNRGPRIRGPGVL